MSSKVLKYDFRSNMGIWQTEDGQWHSLHNPSTSTFPSLGAAYQAEQRAVKAIQRNAKKLEVLSSEETAATYPSAIKIAQQG